MKLKEFFIRNRQVFQLIYGVVLIILIPLLISLNTIFIIKKYNNSIDVSIQKKALITGRLLSDNFIEDLGDWRKLQNKINKLSEKNLDLVDLQILIPAVQKKNEGFKVMASKNKNDVSKFYVSPYYQFAWSQLEGEGLATDSLKISNQETELLEGFSQKDRLWLVSMPIYDSGVKQALLSFKLSSEIIDDITAANRKNSILFLSLTILIVILFLTISVRIWDYAILYKKIKEVDKMKDDFISIASHELRAPLTVIKGSVSMIIEGSYGKIEEGIKGALDNVMASTKRLANLVEDLLNISRIEQGRLKVEKKQLDIAPIIKEITSQLIPSAKEKNLNLIYKDENKNLPKIIGDSDRLKQVLINLINNAIKYTEKGKVEISTEISNEKLKIEISDTGIGISKEDQSRLFEKFYRVKNEKTDNIVGTGLGLWITKKIIELMDGKIFLESMQGAGTRVTIILVLEK